VQSRRAPAFINTCHDARFDPHVGANADCKNNKRIIIMTRGNTTPASRSPHPTDSVQKNPYPTDNPPQSAKKNRAEEERRQGGRRRGRPQAQAATDRAECAAAPHQHQPAPGARRSPTRTLSQTLLPQSTTTESGRHRPKMTSS